MKANRTRKQLFAALGLSSGVALYACSGSSGATSNEHLEQTRIASDPPYRSSVVGTDFDFITEKDPSAFARLEYAGFENFEMPDKRKSDDALIQKAYLFDVYFHGGTKLRIALDKDFGSRQAAEKDVARYLNPLGRLPALYRKNLSHLVVHSGGAETTAFAEDKGRFFVIYSDNATKRIATHDLEETFFHEGTHSSIQTTYLESLAWRNAKKRDNAFITQYARTDDQEDFAESALFAFTLIFHPERFPMAERERIERQIPNRIQFFKGVYTR